jgi:hypothetical protein
MKHTGHQEQLNTKVATLELASDDGRTVSASSINHWVS